MNDELRRLPSVDALLTRVRAEDGAIDATWTTEAARAVLGEARSAARAGAPVPDLDELARRVHERAREMAGPPLRRVINATGVILQTNLGRAPLSERAIAAMAEAARGYSDLEYEVEAGARGSRHNHLRELIRATTGAEDGLVVNNNASAVLMVLQVFAQGREVVVSRGQAVEIGGGFRIPDVLRQSGATLVEVGTTNRTYARDYAAALGEHSAAILRVHSSNFRVVGFTAEADLAELAAVAREQGVLLLDDLGSGCLVDTRDYGMAEEPRVQASIAAGADLVMFSGDKLLGGPQCGIIAGRTELIERLRRHPLARALRVDKLTIAALGATLQSYAEGRQDEEIPVWRMVRLGEASLRRRATRWARAAGPAGAVERSRSMVGGGSLPGEGVPTWCATVAAPNEAELARELRLATPPIIARVAEGRVWLDPRTVDPRDDALVAGVISRSLNR
ncbi:MAG: L-seryl-tRNA(Sec) selenium transferase [Hyphomicrobiales bacterium]